MRDFIIGIDPGLTGGISVMRRNGKVVASVKMPETEQEIRDFVLTYIGYTQLIVIEQVQPMPTGTIAMFKLGRSYGFLRGIIVMTSVRYDEVRPAVWQAALRCLSRGKKAVTRQRAQQLFPDTRITNANADSLLIAEWARRYLIYGGKQLGKGK